MSTVPPWDPDEYDREVKDSRKRVRRERRRLEAAPISALEGRMAGGSYPEGLLQRRSPSSSPRPSLPLPRMRERPDGSWVVVFKDGGGERRRRFSDQEKATAFLDQLKEDG